MRSWRCSPAPSSVTSRPARSPTAIRSSTVSYSKAARFDGEAPTEDSLVTSSAGLDAPRSHSRLRWDRPEGFATATRDEARSRGGPRLVILRFSAVLRGISLVCSTVVDHPVDQVGFLVFADQLAEVLERVKGGSLDAFHQRASGQRDGP